MTIIDGIDVGIFRCGQCGGRELWLFRGQAGEGYKIHCAKCKAGQRDLIDELNLPYLWEDKETAAETTKLSGEPPVLSNEKIGEILEKNEEQMDRMEKYGDWFFSCVVEIIIQAQRDADMRFYNG